MHPEQLQQLPSHLPTATKLGDVANFEKSPTKRALSMCQATLDKQQAADQAKSAEAQLTSTANQPKLQLTGAATSWLGYWVLKVLSEQRKIARGTSQTLR